MKTVAVVVKRGSAEAVALAQQVRARHPELELLAEPELAAATGWPSFSPEEIARRAELILVLGGDGTLIHAARTVRGRSVPILGVNLGTLGFLAEIARADLFPALEAVLAGGLRIEERMRLDVSVEREGKELGSYLRGRAGGEIVANPEEGIDAPIEIDSPAGEKAAAIIERLAASPAAQADLSVSQEGQVLGPFATDEGAFQVNLPSLSG